MAVVATSEERRSLLEAARSFFGEFRLFALGGSPGYSGSLLARVETPDGRWMLRGWPGGFGRGRLSFVHRTLLASREGGFEGVPRLARTERLGALAREAEGPAGRLREGVRRRAEGADRTAALRWLGEMPGAIRAAHEAALRPPEDRPSRVLCYGDVWPAHAFFEGDEFARFVDFEFLAYGPSALDLAQLVAHFGGWKRRGEVVRSYGEVRELGEHERAALAPEAVADLAGEGLWSLSALYGGRPRVGDPRVDVGPCPQPAGPARSLAGGLRRDRSVRSLGLRRAPSS